MAAMMILLGILCSTSVLQLMPGALAEKHYSVKGFVSKRMKWFDHHDTDNDGHLTCEEVKQIHPKTLKEFIGNSKGCLADFLTNFFNTLKSHKGSSSVHAADLGKFDLNGDGKVSKHSAKKRAAELYFESVKQLSAKCQKHFDKPASE